MSRCRDVTRDATRRTALPGFPPRCEAGQFGETPFTVRPLTRLATPAAFQRAHLAPPQASSPAEPCSDRWLFAPHWSLNVACGMRKSPPSVDLIGIAKRRGSLLSVSLPGGAAGPAAGAAVWCCVGGQSLLLLVLPCFSCCRHETPDEEEPSEPSARAERLGGGALTQLLPREGRPREVVSLLDRFPASLCYQ